MLANFLIGLREGMEAALVVGILVAYLVRTGRRAHLTQVWLGVGAAVVLSATVGAVLQYGPAGLSHRTEELVAGVLSVLAVGLVTWMIFWMARSSRALKADLQGRLDAAVSGGRWAVAVVAFLAVAREGLETALFLWAAAGATEGTSPLLGALLGLAVATGLGWAVYRGAVRVNLAAFFLWTGLGLVVIAGGVLAYGIHELQEVGVLPFGTATAYDVSGVLSTEGAVGTVLKGLVNYTPAPSWAQVVAWLAYVGVTTVAYLRVVRGPARPATPPTSAAAPATARPVAA